MTASQTAHQQVVRGTRQAVQIMAIATQQVVVAIAQVVLAQAVIAQIKQEALVPLALTRVIVLIALAPTAHGLL